jgi:hypothetical protein
MARLIYFFLIIAFITIISACGGGSDSNSKNVESSDLSDLSDLDEVLEALTISIEGEEGVLYTGDIPFSDTNEYPKIISYPDVIDTALSSIERIDLVFQIVDRIEEIYFTISGASGHYAFSRTGNDTVAETESVSLTINIPSSLSVENFCANICVKDANESLSAIAEVCMIIGEEAEGRIIYFADFSSNSTLSTLNFDTGEVIDIGQTGYQLTDIAFIGDELYGVTFSNLISIDINTGIGTPIGNIGVGGVNALEGSENILYAGTTGGAFLTIDPGTGEGNVIDQFGLGATSSGDLVFDGNNEFLYGSLSVPGSSTDELVTINPDSGFTEFIGETGFNAVYGLALFRNQLLGLTYGGEFIIIDQETGVGTLIENTDAFSAGGAATATRN